jgi:hypothetical protein
VTARPKRGDLERFATQRLVLIEDVRGLSYGEIHGVAQPEPRRFFFGAPAPA